VANRIVTVTARSSPSSKLLSWASNLLITMVYHPVKEACEESEIPESVADGGVTHRASPKTLSPLETEIAETERLDIEEASTDVSLSTETHVEVRRTVGTLQLAVIVFYSVSGECLRHNAQAILLASLTCSQHSYTSLKGGPFGVEEAVRSAGPFFCLVGFLVGPFLWSIPEAAMTAELGSAYPDASAGVAWVEEAFGARAGWTCGFLGVVSGATDTAIYPLLFLDYVLQVVHFQDPHPLIQYAAVSIFAVVLSYINYRGLSVVGNLSSIICVLSMSPFIIAILVGVFKIDPHLWFRLPEDSANVVLDETSSNWFSRLSLSAILWRPFLNSLFWNLNSFDSAASFSAELEDPGRSFPRAMLLSVILMASCYFIPLLVILGVSDAPQSAWTDGYLATAVAQVSGGWLEDWLIFAAGVTNIGLFQAEMAADAYQVMGMADRGYLPKMFATRSQYGTPTYGILLCLAVVLMMSSANFDKIIEFLNFNYAM